MARKSGTLLKVAAMLGLAVAAKQLSKKENRDAVVNEYNKVKEDPKGYAQDVQNKFNEQTAPYQEKAKQELEKAKSKMNAGKGGSREAANDYAEEGNDNSKISSVQGASSVDDSEGHFTKPDRMDSEGQLTTEQMNEEWVSEGGIHPEEELQDA